MEFDLKRDQPSEKSSVKNQQRKKSTSEASDELPVSVQQEIDDLCYYVPEVTDHFSVLDKIGEGTFSSVFVASLKHPNDIEDRFALKHVIPTSHPHRMIAELKCLQLFGGKENVMGVELCLKNRDHCVIVMRYFAHHKFMDYYHTFSVDDVRDYMKNLLIALRHIHTLDIIHRDVKPTNFLHNIETRKYALVDFGLAQDAPVRLHRENQNKPPFITFTKSSEKENKTSEERRKEESNPGDKKGGTRTPLSPLKLSSPRARGGQEGGTRSQNSQKSASPSKGKQLFAHPQQGHHQHQHQHHSGSQRTTGRSQHRAGAVTTKDNSDTAAAAAKALHRTSVTMSTKGDDAERKMQQKSAGAGAASAAAATMTGATRGEGKGGAVTTTTTMKGDGKHVSSRFAHQASTPRDGADQRVKVQDGRKRKVVRTRVKEGQTNCMCYGRPSVCSLCTQRPVEVAHRAGTPGFRAPEVLMKNPNQTTAVDIWSAGVILLSLLSGRYPFFRGNDDLVCLTQIISLLGTEDVKAAALSYDKLITCKPVVRPLDLKSLCERLRAAEEASSSQSSDAKKDAKGSSTPTPPLRHWAEVPESAVRLLRRLLDPNPATRITAQDALNSDFLQGR